MAASSRIVSIASRICVAAAFTIASIAPSRTQPILMAPDTPVELLREAFDMPYGRALIEEFNTRVREHADAVCLRANPRSGAQHAEQGESFLRTWGLRAVEAFYAGAGDAAYRSTIETVLGPNAQDDLMRLSAESDVSRYQTIERPQRLAFTLDFVFETIDRYLLLNRVKMKQVAPLSTGNMELLNASPVEQVGDALAAFLDANKSASLERYVVLSQMIEENLREAAKADAVTANILLKGIDPDFRALCIMSEIAN